MQYLWYIPVILISYLLGSSNLAYFMAKAKDIDLRSGGSGNLGTANATFMMGAKAGALTLLHDVAKSAIPILLSQHFLGDKLPFVGAVAGTSAIIGHMYPFYLKFKGGKGLASLLGAALALDWRIFVGAFLLLAAVTLITDYIAPGTISVSIGIPVAVGIIQKSWIPAAILFISTGIIISKHIVNIRRIFEGTEIGLRSSSSTRYSRRKGQEPGRKTE